MYMYLIVACVYWGKGICFPLSKALACKPSFKLCTVKIVVAMLYMM